MRLLRRRLGWTLVGLSLALHLFTVVCYGSQPDFFAAFTVLPIWVWGGIGLALCVVAFHLLHSFRPLVLAAVWIATLLIGSDEARVLANFKNAAPRPGPAEAHEGTPVFRVATVNCALFKYGDPSSDIAAWKPDVVLLQDVYPHHAQRVTDVVFAGNGNHCVHQTTKGGVAIATRWKILREIPNPAMRSLQVTIEPPDGHPFEVVNVHLTTAATDLALWRRHAWHDHRMNRAMRLREISMVWQGLKQTTNFPNSPALFGGDFNAGATDIVHRQMSSNSVDAFAAAGTGWGNTYQRRFPILRIDQLYATPHFKPVRCRTVTTRHSDHRMVVADFVAR